MQPTHDRYCDETHTPRQACNDALAPPELRASAPIEPMASEPEPSVGAEPEDPPTPSAVREAIAIAQMPPPTPYVTRAWEQTAAAVAGVAEPDAVAADPGSGGRGVLRVAAVVGLIVALFLFVLRVRRGAGDEG